MKVTVTNKCDRCKREAPVEIDHTEVEPLQAVQKARLDNLDALKRGLETYNGALPDLVVIFKGSIKSIDHVCDANCKETIGHQLEAMFREIDPTKRAPRKTRTPGETPTETSHTHEEKAGHLVVEGGAHPKADPKSQPKPKQK